MVAPVAHRDEVHSRPSRVAIDVVLFVGSLLMLMHQQNKEVPDSLVQFVSTVTMSVGGGLLLDRIVERALAPSD